MTKTNTCRVDEWNSEAVSFQLGEKWLSQNLLCSHKYELLFAALYKIIFLTKSCEYSCHQSIWQVFSHLIINHTWKQQTTALKGLPAIICLVQSGILWWNDVAVFSISKKNDINKKVASPKCSCWCKMSWYLPHCISSKWQSMSVTIFNPIKDAYSIWS